MGNSFETSRIEKICNIESIEFNKNLDQGSYPGPEESSYQVPEKLAVLLLPENL